MAITATSDFECGSGADFVISGNDVALDAEEDVTAVPISAWFYFKLSGVDGTTPAITVSYANPLLALTGARPIYSFDRVTWTDVEGTWSEPDLTFSLPAISGHSDVWIALHIPYSYTDLIDDVAVWGGSSHCTLENLGTSQGGRNLYYLKVDAASTKRKVNIVMTCRCHGGEPMASFYLRGMLDWLLGSEASAQSLRECVTLHIFPMVNPDGVYHGRNRAYDSGTDANRDYDEINGPGGANEEAETALIHTVINDVDTDTGIDFFVDIHGGGEGPCIWRDTGEFSSVIEGYIEAYIALYDAPGQFWNPGMTQHENVNATTATTWRDGMFDQYAIYGCTVEGGFFGYDDWGWPDAADLEAGGAVLLKAIIRSILKRYRPTGWTWGEDGTIPNESASLDNWMVATTGADARNDSAFGKLQLASNDAFISPVMDTLDANSKVLDINFDTFGTGTGGGNLFWRGDSASFAATKPEASIPWGTFTVKTTKQWQWVQIKAVANG